MSNPPSSPPLVPVVLPSVQAGPGPPLSPTLPARQPHDPPSTPPRGRSSSPLPLATTPSPTSTPPQRLPASPSSPTSSPARNGNRSPATSATATGAAASGPSTTRRSPSPSSSPSSSSSSSSPGSSPNRGGASGSRRVKLYVLRNDNWDDLGTGNCSSHVADPALGARPEDEGAWIFVQKEPQEGQTEGAVILRTKIQPYPPGYVSDDEDDDDAPPGDRVEDPGGYQRQQDTLIVWTDRATESDMALSFATATGCAEIWNFIRKARRWSADQITASPSPSPSLSSAHSFPVYSGAHTKLPEPTLGNIELIEHTIRGLGRTVVGRERTASAIFKSDYIRKLIKIHEEAEDLESLPDLHALCRVMQTILLLNDSAIFELVLRDEVVFGVVSILEYDPEFPTMKASYKAHLSDSSHFTQVVPIRSPSLLAKIHQTHRLYYFKDVILARILEDSTFSILNSTIYFNEVDIVNEVASDPILLKELFAIFDEEDAVSGPAEPTPSKETPKGPIGPQLPPELAVALGLDTPTPEPSSTVPVPMDVDAAPETGPPAPAAPTKPPSDRKHDAILFLQQFSSMAKNLQLALRAQLFRSLADRGLLRVIEVALSRTVTREDPLMRSATIEILMTLVDHDPSSVRGYSLKQQAAGKRPLVVFLIELFHKEEDLGLKAQMSEALRVLVDAGGEGGPLEAPPRLRQDDPEAEKFLQYFYDHCISSLLLPILALPATDHLDLNPVDVALCGHLCDLLCFFVSHHTFRSKYFVLSTQISSSVVKLFRARQKHLRLAALRYFRACIGRNDDFYNRFLIKNDLFLPVLEVAIAEHGRDNLLNSACLEFFEYIRTTNAKAVINHLMERYGDKIRKLEPTVKTFQLLVVKWEQNNEPPPKSDAAPVGAGPTSKPMTREGSFARIDREEENYFDGSDDEDDKPAAGGSRKREGDAPERDRKRPRVDPTSPASTTVGLPRSKTWPVAGATKGKGLVDYGEEEDEDTMGGFIRAPPLVPIETMAQAVAPTNGSKTSGEASNPTPTITPTPTPPPSGPDASPAEFKLRELKRKADDDDDTLSLISKGKKATTGTKVAPPAKAGQTSNPPAAGIKISFGVKASSLGKGGGSG